MRKLEFTVTAGHGGTDPGAVHHGYREADLMRSLRNIVADKLRAAGHVVHTDGEGDENQPLQDAMRLVKRSAVALELHTNANENPQARGVEVVALPERKELAQAIAREIATVLGAPLRGTGGWIDQSKTARGRLGFVNAGGMVVEVFFISNAEELGRYMRAEWPVASAIVRALQAHAEAKA